VGDELVRRAISPDKLNQSREIGVGRIRLPLQLAERRVLLITIDTVLVIGTILVSLRIWAWRAGVAFDTSYLLKEILWFPSLTLLWLILASANELYDQRVAGDVERSAKTLLRITGLLVFIYLAIYFGSPRDTLPRLFILYFGTLSFVLLGVWRMIYGTLFSRAAFRRPAVIVGAGRAGSTLVATLGNHLSQMYELVGFIDDDVNKQDQGVEGLPVLGRAAKMPQLVDGGVTEIVLAITHGLSAEMFQALLDCQEKGARITPMPVLYEDITGRVPVEHIGEHWRLALPIGHAATGSFYPMIKRSMDITSAVLGLVVVAMIFPVVYIAMKLDTPGPIFFAQERVGKGGKPFKLVKFRTMVVDAERDGAVWAQEEDPRVTRVGRLLRKTRLDELPQCINVLRGEMSAVGPRPERPEFVDGLVEEIPFYRVRHAVKPGIAGWAVIHDGYASSVRETVTKLGYDLYYIKHQSIFLDLAILLRSIGVALSFKGR